jgi:ribosome-associated toxin RatA of RatAB toxin-antitoxin module
MRPLVPGCTAWRYLQQCVIVSADDKGLLTADMRTIHRKATVPYRPAEMYELVNDIEAYPQFLPWCKRARVLDRDECRIQARLTVAKGRVEKSFTTLNMLQEDRQVEMRLVEGPFRKLEGLWRFEPAGNGCHVSLKLAFELSGKIMVFTLGPMFNQVANSLVDAFVQRARDVYGTR